MAFSEAALAYEHLAEIHLWSQQESDTRLLIANASLHMLNLAERAGPSSELARAYGGMRIAAGFIPWYTLAEIYGRQAMETAQRVNQLPALGWVLFLGGIYNLGLGRWAEAENMLSRSVEIYEQLGDHYRWAQAKANLAKLAYYRAQFAQGAKLATDAYTVAHDRDDLLPQAWGLYQQGENALRLGQTDEAITFLEAALQVYAKNPDRLTKAVAYGLLAVARLHQDQPELALLAAEAGAQVLAQSSLDVFVRFQAYAGIAEVYLRLCEGQTQPNLKIKARQMCRAFRKFTRIFPIGRPGFWLCQGLYEWLAGHPSRAHQAWQKSLTEAERLAMPYEQGLAHYEIGRHLVVNDSARQMHLNRACEIFARLEAAYDLARAQAAARQGC
jgi:tetratricopeptide (TPR) repeat protein